MKKVIGGFLVVIGLGLATTHASAQLLSYEGFNYSVGANLDTQSGGTGWAANWGQFTGDGTGYTNTSGSLSDPTHTLLTSGNKVSTGASSSSFEARYNQITNYGGNGTTNFFSILIRPDNLGASGQDSSGGDGYFFLQLYGGSGVGNTLFAGKNSESADWGLVQGTTTNNHSFSSIAAVSNQTVFLVVEGDYTSGADTFKLFVNPTPGAPEPAVPSATLSFDIGTQNGLGINTGNGAAASYDEIRVGTTFASVTPVPEPSAFVLVAFGLASLVGYRFRRGARR
jgi:hypothetical protein